jgi:hypothetical protein
VEPTGIENIRVAKRDAAGEAPSMGRGPDHSKGYEHTVVLATETMGGRVWKRHAFEADLYAHTDLGRPGPELEAD